MSATVSDAWQPSGRSTWPDTPNGPERYMTLPGKRKMVRIRHTIYEDPGNPFQDELDAERGDDRMVVPADCDKALPEAPDEVSPTGRSFFELTLEDDFPRESSGAAGMHRQSLNSGAPLAYEHGEGFSTMSSFRFEIKEPESRQPSESGRYPYTAAPEQMSRAVRREHHRSMSLAIPRSPPPTGEEYVSPRRDWRRKNSLPLLSERPGEGSAGPKSARDTKFYGFYDDLMKDYEKRWKKL